jgi:hypothetical protein
MSLLHMSSHHPIEGIESLPKIPHISQYRHSRGSLLMRMNSPQQCCGNVTCVSLSLIIHLRLLRWCQQSCDNNWLFKILRLRTSGMTSCSLADWYQSYRLLHFVWCSNSFFRKFGTSLSAELHCVSFWTTVSFIYVLVRTPFPTHARVCKETTEKAVRDNEASDLCFWGARVQYWSEHRLSWPTHFVLLFCSSGNLQDIALN